MDIFIPSDSTDDIYRVSAHVDRIAGRWVALACDVRCKGFANHGKCKHITKANDFIAKMPVPKEPGMVELRRRFNIHCGICGGYEFIIRPRPGEDGYDIICSACGRLYQL